MSPLDQGTEIILAVDGGWYRELARQGLLPKSGDTTGAELLMGKVQDAKFHHGLLIEFDQVTSQLTNRSFLIPWHVILAIGVATEAERKKVIGFRGVKQAGAVA